MMKVGSKYLPAVGSTTDAHMLASWPAGSTLSIRSDVLSPSQRNVDTPAHRELKTLYEELHRRMHHHTVEAERVTGISAPPPGDAFSTPLPWASRSIRAGSPPASGPGF